MTYDVFISYSSKDQKVAEGICGYLEANGVRCFVAYRDIPRGKVWAREVVNGIEESRMMVVVFSRDFNLSEQVDREIELAAEDNKPILTFRIADAEFTGAKKYYLKNINWIDAFPDPASMFDSLLSNIKMLLGYNPTINNPIPTPVQKSTPSKKKESVIDISAPIKDAGVAVPEPNNAYPRTDWNDEDRKIFNAIFKPFGIDMLDFSVNRLAAFRKSNGWHKGWGNLEAHDSIFGKSCHMLFEVRSEKRRNLLFMPTGEHIKVFNHIIFDNLSIEEQNSVTLSFRDWFENKMGLECSYVSDLTLTEGKYYHFVGCFNGCGVSVIITNQIEQWRSVKPNVDISIVEEKITEYL